MKSFTHICLLVLLITPSWLLSQLPILIQPPALSPTNPTVVDLLSGTLQNTRSFALRIYLQAEVFKNGPLIAKGTSARFELQPGTLVINSVNADQLLSPVSGDYYSPVDRDYIQRTGALPPGDYLICVRAYADNDTLQFLLGETCYNHSVMDLNPPILVLPSNGEVVEVPFPTFVWTPPTPLPPQPSYRLRIAPLLGNQSPVVALGNNTAFHDVDGLFTNLYQYPIAARQFEHERRYAWQVAVYKDDALLTQSEIFTFTYRDPRAVPPAPPLDKVLMIIGMANQDTVIVRDPADLRFFKDNGELTFSELGHFAVPTLVYKIMDKDQKVLTDQIVFERVGNGAGFEMRFFAPPNQSGQTMGYLHYVSPGGEVFSYRFRE